MEQWKIFFWFGVYFPISKNKTSIYNLFFLLHSVHSFGALPENNQENNGVFSLPHYLVCVQSYCFSFFILLNYGKKHLSLRILFVLSLQYTRNGLNKTAFVCLSECFMCSLFSVVYSLPSSHKSVYDILQVISAMLEISVFSY